MDDNPEQYWSIGEIAKDLGVTLRFLRFHEQKGSLQPRRIGHSRLYDAEQRNVAAELAQNQRRSRSGAFKRIRKRKANKVFADTQSMSLADIAEEIAALHRERDRIDVEIAKLERSYAVRQGADPLLLAPQRSRRGMSSEDAASAQNQKRD